VRTYMLRLNTVKIGEIVLHDIEAGVIDGPQPDVPLLGMSFLGRLEMKRDGNRMDLIKKY
jgi:aspartyl protease family protein